MGFFELAVEDSSPLISYAPAGAWVENPANDSLIPSYSGSSLHTTSARGATATINFNGTGISIFGAKRPEYGAYSITVDGQLVTNGTANSTSPDFNQLMGTVADLPNGPHTAVLTNTGTKPIDIDWMKLATEIGIPGASVATKTIDDADPQFTYGPTATDWETSSSSTYIDGGLHFTQTPGAQASVSFTGDAVALYGTVSQDHANIKVTLNGVSKSFTGGSGGHVSGLRPKTLLFYANNLTPGQSHQLVVSPDAQPGTGPFIDVDGIVVFTSSGGANGTVTNPTNPSSVTGSSTATPPSPSATGDSGGNNGDSGAQSGSRAKSSITSRKPPLIAIIIASSVTFLIILVLLAFFIRRRMAKRVPATAVQLPSSPQLPIQSPSMMEKGYFRRNEGSGSSSLLPLPTFRSMNMDDGRSQASSDVSIRSYSSNSPMLPPVPVLVLPELPVRNASAPRSKNVDHSPRPTRPNLPPRMTLPDFDIPDIPHAS